MWLGTRGMRRAAAWPLAERGRTVPKARAAAGLRRAAQWSHPGTQAGTHTTTHPPTGGVAVDVGAMRGDGAQLDHLRARTGHGPNEFSTERHRVWHAPPPRKGTRKSVTARARRVRVTARVRALPPPAGTCAPWPRSVAAPSRCPLRRVAAGGVGRGGWQIEVASAPGGKHTSGAHVTLARHAHGGERRRNMPRHRRQAGRTASKDENNINRTLTKGSNKGQQRVSRGRRAPTCRPDPMNPVERLSHRFSFTPVSSHFHCRRRAGGEGGAACRAGAAAGVVLKTEGLSDGRGCPGRAAGSAFAGP